MTMNRSLKVALGCSMILAEIFALGGSVFAHDDRSYVRPARHAAEVAAAPPHAVPGISGQGLMRFRVLYTSSSLPEEARKVLIKAHGGFAVDRRAGKGETYFALPGAGILQISSDLKDIRVLSTSPDMKNVNLHNTTIWFTQDGRPYLVFPANDAGKVFTTTLDGDLVNTLDSPTAEDEFEQSEVHDYFLGRGNFAPTDVEELGGLYYVTTGYSNLDYVLTARILGTDPFKAVWNDLVFGGKGDAHGQFQTAHGITIPPGTKRLDIADRPHSRVERFGRYGHYLSTLQMPAGSLPCDIYYLDQYAVVGSLDGPDTKKGAPIYIFENDKLI